MAPFYLRSSVDFDSDFVPAVVRVQVQYFSRPNQPPVLLDVGTRIVVDVRESIAKTGDDYFEIGKRAYQLLAN